MSAPQTNIEVQKRRHRGPLIGMAVVVVFAVGLIVYWLIKEAANGDSPQNPDSESMELSATIDAAAPVAPEK